MYMQGNPKDISRKYTCCITEKNIIYILSVCL